MSTRVTASAADPPVRQDPHERLPAPLPSHGGQSGAGVGVQQDSPGVVEYGQVQLHAVSPARQCYAGDLRG